MTATSTICATNRFQLLEARGNLQRMLVQIPLTDDEQAAVQDGTAAVERLLDRLRDTQLQLVPRRAGWRPRQLRPPGSADYSGIPALSFRCYATPNFYAAVMYDAPIVGTVAQSYHNMLIVMRALDSAEMHQPMTIADPPGGLEALGVAAVAAACVRGLVCWAADQGDGAARRSFRPVPPKRRLVCADKLHHNVRVRARDARRRPNVTSAPCGRDKGGSPASRLPPAQTVAQPPELALRAERFRLPGSRCELEYRLSPWRARPSCLTRLEPSARHMWTSRSRAERGRPTLLGGSRYGSSWSNSPSN